MDSLVDGHNDALLQLRRADAPVTAFAEGDESHHFDLPRASEVGLVVSLFAAFVPSEDAPDRRETPAGYEYPLPDALDHDDARQETYRMLELLSRLERDVAGFRVVRSESDLDACFESGDLGAVAHLEGAQGVAPDLANLDFLYAAGVRSIGPVWSRPNAFGEGVAVRYPGDPDTGAGLTAEGEALVRACERRGILVDGAHLTERGFWDVADLLDSPFVVSHAAAHALCEHSRNLTDEQLAAVADAGGVVGVTFSEGSLTDVADSGASASLADVADHVEYVADRAGVEHVAFGSDFDGATVPDDVGDATGLADLVAELRERGFGESAVEKIACDNWCRVFREVW